MSEEKRKVNDFMDIALQYLHGNIYRLERELEQNKTRAYPYKAEIELKIITLAQELAQLHWTESVLLHIYDPDVPMFELKPEYRNEQILERLANGEKASDLAKEYRITESAISQIKKRHKAKENEANHGR